MQEAGMHYALGCSARGSYALCSARDSYAQCSAMRQLCTMHLTAMQCGSYALCNATCSYALCNARGSYALCSALFRNAVSARQWIRPSKEGRSPNTIRILGPIDWSSEPTWCSSSRSESLNLIFNPDPWSWSLILILDDSSLRSDLKLLSKTQLSLDPFSPLVCSENVSL